MASKHQTVKLEFAKREGTGKGTCRKLRSKDQLPVVLYGPEYKNGLAGVISARAVAPVANSAHRETTLIELDFADGGSATALIRDVQRHPLRRSPRLRRARHPRRGPAERHPRGNRIRRPGP